MDHQKNSNAEISPPALDQVFELFLACREMDSEARSAWLQQACGGDPLLQREVENLLLEDLSAQGFLSRPAAFLTSTFASTPIHDGQQFGRYTITGFLGRGGMGEVWKAHDQELDRVVALKFLNSGLPIDQLTQEARMASALNHPGIVTVYDVIVWEGTPILVMELVTGTPLSHFCNGPVPIDQLASIAAQVASALADAHAEDIVHGDLKPDNIVLRADGIAKILDFGVARKVSKTTAAALAGTPLYMSPEQARGEAARTASDVYSFGLVLFELATGRHPFGRQTLGEISTRQGRPPRASSLRKQLPEELEGLIDRMLEPSPTKRISMREAAEQLRRLEHASIRHQGWKLVAFVASLAVVGVLIGGLWAYRHRSSSIDVSRMTIRPLASQSGLESNPSISPDGLWIACLYRARTPDRAQLQVHSVKGGPPVVIDTGSLVVQRPAAWSPDSSELIFSALQGSTTHSIYRVHRTGGTPRRVAECRSRRDEGCEMDWSPDGTTLAIADRWPGHSELYLLDLAGGRRRDMIAPDKQYLTTPRFSPDGKWIAYLQEPSMTSDDIYVVATAGGQRRRITRDPWYLRGFTWSTDGKGLIAVSSRGSNKLQMWQFPIDGSEPFRVGDLDAGRGSDLSLCRRTGSLAWVRDLSANSLWRMPTEGGGQPAEQLVNSAAVDVDAEWSGDGRMVFRSDRSGVQELWIANADGSGPWQATHFRGAFVGDPHWSPDGRAIAFTSHITGNPDIFLMQCDRDKTVCSEPRQLTRSSATDANPTWSRDGHSIYFSSNRSGNYEVWRMPVAGRTAPQRITWNEGYMARESADGTWLYYSKLWESTGFWRIALPARGPGQTETPVVQNIPFMAGATWALGAHELFYYPSTNSSAVPFPAVRAVDVKTGRGRDLPVGNVRLSRGLSLSSDGGWLLRSQNDRTLTLIMLAEQEKVSR